MQLLRLRCDAEGFYLARGTLKDMAAELGLTHEALYRALASLEQGKRIRRDAGVLRILSFKPESP
jgi:DNA-binding phage protein